MGGPMTEAKICGLKTPEHLRLAAQEGARYAGLVFYPPSPRALTREQGALLARQAPPGLAVVGLFVDPDDAFLDEILKQVPLGMVQLHGDEAPRRVAAIRARTGLPVMKALRVAAPEDLEPLSLYENVADWILFDAKSAAPLPGGNGVAFDWTILKDTRPRKPWMLSGGLTPENVRTALSVLQPDAVDVSSGVEDTPGIKSADKIRTFLQAVKGA